MRIKKKLKILPPYNITLPKMIEAVILSALSVALLFPCSDSVSQDAVNYKQLPHTHMA
jgi:hypothetical protein